MKIEINNGMVLHLYKHLDGSMFDDDPRPHNKSNDSERTMIAFGNFDRLCFDPVNRFVEFLSQSSDAYRWTGGRKDIMLYPLEADEHRHFVFGPKEPGYVQPPFLIRENPDDKEPCDRNFVLVSMLYISSKAKASVKQYQSFLASIKTAIYNVVSKYNAELKKLNKEPIICEVFGTFNSPEIALMWAADQFTDVQYIIDHIRYLHLEFDATGDIEPVFVSTYTIIALTDNDRDLSEISGGAMIQLASSTARCGDDIKDFTGPLDYLIQLPAAEKMKIDCCAGEYDFIVESLPPQLKLLLKSEKSLVDGQLHVDNAIFKKLFSHSTTRLFYRAEDIHESMKALPWQNLISIKVSEAERAANISKQWENTRKIAGTSDDRIAQAFKEYKEKILSVIQSTSTFGCILDLLFSDYIQCVNTTPDRQWAEDLKAQLDATINVLEKYFEHYKYEHSAEREAFIDQNFIDQVREVLSVLEEQIHHVSDAGKLFFDEPCSHAESTGQYDLLFHMYYGVAKYILSILYATRKKKAVSAQSSLIPLIRFDPVPSLQSKLYFDLPVVNQRIIDISVPQNAWCEPGQYIPLLIHELYHYAAPVDRKVRNESFAKILISEINTFAVQLALEKIRENVLEVKKGAAIATASENSFRNALLRVVHTVRKVFVSHLKKYDISKVLGDVCNGDTQWTEYEKVLFDWVSGRHGYDLSSTNYGAYIRKALNYMGKKLALELDSPHIEPIDKELLTILIHELTDTVCDDKYQHIESDIIFSKLVRDAQSELWDSIVSQLREIAPDISMAQLSEISAVDYMLIFASFQDKMLTRPGELREMDCGLSLRIGFILDFILDKPKFEGKDRLKLLMQCEEQFCKKYIAYVNNCRWSEYNQKDKPDVNAGKWFSYFIDQYEDYLINYSPYHELLRILAKEQFVPLCSKKEDNLIAQCSRNYFNALSADDIQEAVFKCNIEFVHSFQPQAFLFDLVVSPIGESNTSASTPLHWSIPKSGSSHKPKEEENWSITRSNEHGEPISQASERLSKTHYKVFGTEPAKCELWYRGSQNADFDILPSIMVHFLDKNQLSHSIRSNEIKGVNSQGTLWEYQRSILERFKNKADGAPEFINSASYTASDYMALMQHYGQYTSYLDWSEDVYTSLFFALESEVQLEDSKFGGKDASLYILDPMLYNRARKMLIEHAAKNNPETFCPQDCWMRRQANRIQEMPDGHIPNLSLRYNRDRFGMFSFDIPEDEDVNTSRPTKYLSCNGLPKDATLAQFELEMWNLPLAVYTSRLNARLRSQSGQFMVFSPFSLPVYSDEPETKEMPSADRFAYLSLLKIQEYFLACFASEEPFMYEIKIRAFTRDQMGDYLRKAGINRYRIYPELDNLQKF